MKDKIQAAIKSAREKNKGKIAPAADIYEAIFKAGMKEVGDWIESVPTRTIDGAEQYICTLEQWQAFRKEWGL